MTRRSGSTPSPKASVDLLRPLSFFDGFSEEELEAAAALGRRQTVAAGELIIDQGDFGTSCHVIVSGSATVSIRGDVVASVGEGAMVGEMALIEHRPRSAAVRAETDVELLTFMVKEFRRLLDASPKTARRVNELLSARLAFNADQNRG